MRLDKMVTFHDKRNMFPESFIHDFSTCEFFDEIHKKMNLDAIPSQIPVRYGWIVHYADQRLLPTDDGLYQIKFDVDFDEYFSKEREVLDEIEESGLILNDFAKIEVTDLGRIFIRNVCMVFDKYLNAKSPAVKFSRIV